MFVGEKLIENTLGTSSNKTVNQTKDINMTRQIKEVDDLTIKVCDNCNGKGKLVTGKFCEKCKGKGDYVVRETKYFTHHSNKTK